jgi:hypothetical protein
MAKPQVAFISGHIDLPQTDFNAIYIPLINSALTKAHAFILGDAPGVDTMALTYLLSLSPKDDLKSRIAVYASRKDNVPKFQALGVDVIGPEAARLLKPTLEIEALVGVQNEGRDKARYRHLVRDTHMTLNSDYDILYVRSEEECRKVYGGGYRVRVSATEHNRTRREKVLASAALQRIPGAGGEP